MYLQAVVRVFRSGIHNFQLVNKLEIVDVRSEDPDDCLKVQLWKYNPSHFAREGCVDPVSLACTFQGNKDERIEMSVEKLLEEL